METPSLDGRSFRDVTPVHGGDVGDGTVFEYHEEEDGTVWGRYLGGAVRLGFLVGVRKNDELDFRYSHVTTTGESASGHCLSRIEQRADGRIQMHESWAWETREGSGTSLVEEIRP